MTKEDLNSDLSHSVFYHRLMESLKHGYSVRNKLGDENYLDLENILQEMQNESYIDHIRNKINDLKTFKSSDYGPFFFKEHHGTGELLFYL